MMSLATDITADATTQQLVLEQDAATPRLQAELRNVLDVMEVNTQGGPQPAIIFTGRLLCDSDSALTTLTERFGPLGYTPLIRRKGRQDVVVAIEGIPSLGKPRLWVNGVLLLATIVTTMLAGAMLRGYDVMRNPADIVNGLPFALTLLAILGAHELGHYFMGKWHGVQVTLPYFIPMPLGLGTFGAFIQMRSPIRNRRALFDVGFAGPIAGFVVALPLLILGLAMSEVVRAPFGSAGVLGKSLLIQFLIDLLQPHGSGYVMQLHPVALAAYFGILLTGFNLLPAGQLDGGHVAYAAFGPAARPVAMITVAAIVLLGVLVWSGWLIWAAFVFLTGMRHAAPLNDVTPLDWGRKMIGVGAVVLFLLTFIPKPF